MKLLKILCLTSMAIAHIEAIEIENRSTTNAYITQITTLNDNGLDQVPSIQQTYIVLVPGQTINTDTYGSQYQTVTNVTFNLNNALYEVRAAPENTNAKVIINNNGSVTTTEGVGLSRQSKNISQQILIQGTRML